MRRHEKDFMLRRDQKYVGELKKAAAEFSRLLATAELRAGAEGRNRPEAGEIPDRFSRLGRWRAGSRRHWCGDVEEFHGIEPIILEIQQAVELLYKEADAAEAATRGSVRIWMLIALATGGRDCDRRVVLDRPVDIDSAFGDGPRHDQACGWRCHDCDTRPRPQGRGRRNGRRG